MNGGAKKTLTSSNNNEMFPNNPCDLKNGQCVYKVHYFFWVTVSLRFDVIFFGTAMF